MRSNNSDREDRSGNYMHMASGGKFWPFDPHAEDINILDIITSLSNQCRYNGHTQKVNAKFTDGVTRPYFFDNHFYSVAEHCVYVSQIVPKKHAFAALMHDAAEAYLGDMIRPMKYSPLFHNNYTSLEEQNEEVIFKKFGIKYPFHKSIKKADEALAAAEASQVVRKDHTHEGAALLHDHSTVAKVEIKFMLPGHARFAFVDRYMNLTIDDHPELYAQIQQDLKQYADGFEKHRAA